MHHTRVLFWTLVLMLGVGIAEGRPGADSGLAIIPGRVAVYLCYLWYRTDAAARNLGRNGWLELGVLLFPPGGISCYLLRSRPREARARALLVFAAYLVLTVLAEWIGHAIHIGLAV